MFQVRLKKPRYSGYAGITFDTLRKAKNYAKKLKANNPDDQVNIYELGIVGERLAFSL